MSLMTISRAISAGVQRNVAVAELKHEAKIADVRHALAANALLRLDEHSARLAKARMAHVKWLEESDEQTKACFEQSKSDLQRALASPEA